MFIVMCRVSGGVTGTREAPLKSNGRVIRFGEREEAQTRADALMAENNEARRGSARRTVLFQYWVEEDGQ